MVPDRKHTALYNNPNNPNNPNTTHCNLLTSINSSQPIVYTLEKKCKIYLAQLN